MKIVKLRKLNHYHILYLGLYIYYFCIAIFNPEYAGLNFSNFIFSVLCVLSLLQVSTKPKVNKCNCLIFSTFYLVLIIYVLKSQDIINSTIIFVKLLIPLLSYGIISIVIDKFGIDSFSKLLFRANLAACFVGIIVFYAFGDTSYLMVYRGEVISRMTGSFIQPNVFCAFLILTIPFGIHTIISKYRWGGIIN